MCGIAGIVDPALPAGEVSRLLRRMTDSLVHRGPDEEGFYAADGVGLGIRRLRIIDVAGGQQPIANEDGRVQVVFNGEIYNFPHLRAELQRRGHVFRTRSDTEVIAHLYEEDKTGFLAHLRGMFAIAIWDDDDKRLVLARDRLGKKPLFYAAHGGRLLFGSEIKALLAAEPALCEPDREATVPYFRYGFVPEPLTMFRHVRKLPAAHYLTINDGRLDMTRYWSLDFSNASTYSENPERVAEELDALLAESVRIRLMSEVPLGVFLSGGLDSSTIVAYAHKAGYRPIKTFTIGFDRKQWDESYHAGVVAQHFQTDHHILELRQDEILAHLPDTVTSIVHHCDEPFGDSSALPTYFVSKLAREHVTVILGGDGGDELFAGYSSYQGIRFAEAYQRLPGPLKSQILPGLVQTLARTLPPGRRYAALRAAKVLRDSQLPFEQMYFSKAAIVGDDLLRRLLTAEVTSELAPPGAPAWQDDIGRVLRSDWPALSKASYVDLRFGLLEDMLVKVDRMSMAHSLEVRSPFLDHRLVEFAARLAPSLKLRGWQTKAILRDTLRRYLPAATLRKRKQGFSVPLREWLRCGLQDMVGDYLETAHAQLPDGVFERSTIARVLGEHRRGEVDHSSIIWSLLNYAVWFGLYVRQTPPVVEQRVVC